MKTRVNALAHLVQTLQTEGEILVFLGAGSSTEGSQGEGPFPDFETLISRVLLDEGVGITENRMNDFLDIMRRWERESVLSARMASYLYGNPGISHLQLASVTMSMFPDVNMTLYLTTNFDDLMFKALSAVTRNLPQRDPKAFSLKKSTVISELTEIFRAIPSHTHKGTPVIVKLFGDLASNSPIFDSQDMPFDEFTEEKLIKLLDRTTLFIGYGFHDAPILRLLIRSASRHPVFVVAPENPIDDQIVHISQRQFYWIPKTFAEFTSELITTFSVRRPRFEETFTSFLREAGAGFILSSRWALRDCTKSASAPARARFLNRARSGAAGRDAFSRGITRPETGPDLGAFKNSDSRILGIIGESGSGKSTLLFQIYERGLDSDDDLYIYYDAQSFQAGGSLAAKLAFDLAAETVKLSSVLRQIASSFERNGACLFILIDALNENSSIDPLAIRYEIESLASSLPRSVRFIYTCRRVFWDARMNPSNDLPLGLYSEGKVFLLSKFSIAEAESAYWQYSNEFNLRASYESLSMSVREHMRDPLMLRLISRVYSGSALPQFAPAVLVFQEVMGALRRRYHQTILIDFLDCLIDQRLDDLRENGDANDIFSYRAVRTDSNLALLAQQMIANRHVDHPLTILEDENIITSMEGAAVRFKFTYERFYEYLIGLRLHYRIFILERLSLFSFIEANLERFRDAHYSFYQGLKSAFVTEYLGCNDLQRRREIAKLARHADRSISALGTDILREVVFESGHDAVHTLALLGDQSASTTALVLDLGFESEGVLTYAVKGLFDADIQIRRRSVHCLIFQARNFGAMDAIQSMILDAAENDDTVRSEALVVGLVYFFAVGFGAAADKSEAMQSMRRLLATLIARLPGRVDIASLAKALNDIVEAEGPLFFGANYDKDGITYPWQTSRKDVIQHTAAMRSLLQDPSPEMLKRHLDAVLFFSDIRIERTQDTCEVRLFAFQLEYRLVQWILIRAWAQNTAAVLELLDRIVEQGGAFNIDFALGIVEHGVFQVPATDRELLTKCRSKMSQWIEHFESHFPSEFYLSFKAEDPFSFNLAPLAVLAHVEAEFFTAESGVIPSIGSWLADPSPNRRKMALLAANWLAPEFPAKALTTLESTVHQGGLEDWYDRVLAGYEKHAPRLLDEFFNRMYFQMRRRTKIRTADIARESADVQYHGEAFFTWLFLGPESRLRRIEEVYDMIYSVPSLLEFFCHLLERWVADSVPVK
jgi:hypothetical protein